MEVSKTTEKYMLAAFAGIVIAFLAANWSKLFPSASNQISKDLANLAKKHYEIWGKGTIKEGDPRTLSYLNDYWKSVGWANRSQADKISNPWSAAFISHMMELAGSPDFKKSASHSDYIVQSIINRVSNNGTYRGFKPHEVKVEVGDIVARPRANSKANYESTGKYASHSDIVTDISNGYATMIGGNISNSVSTTKMKLDPNGKIDPTEIAKRGYFVIIKNI